ncbi:phosphomannomutase [Halomarina oriensis]|uniref:Phosphomannomutase n=1 Tax=Halomarina oriensis TaxID=671145 RepID=A0A6B0GT94_9EURY|nr:phosphomannomutase [Halomarina oriensis]MWG36899.1 phosphomannomutase [Halomarina oriensis]
MDLFGTAGIRGDARERVTPELALAVGRALAGELRAQGGDELVVSRDGRTTGTGLVAAVEAGATSGGATVRRAGQLPTPALAFASQGRFGLQVTASHNPPTDNGLKLFVDGEEFDAAAEGRIERAVEDGTTPERWDVWAGTTHVSPLAAYREAVTEFALGHGDPLDGQTVVVDCGNGMAALATPQVLRALGARVVTLNGNVDGHFPGRPSKPTPETLGDLMAFVAGSDEDDVLGIAHDGDADRIVVVDGDGEVVHEDTVLAVLAEHYTTTSDAADPVVVTTPNASGRIDERVEATGGRVERVRLGSLHEGIAAARAAGGDVVFAGEPWKHIHTAFGPWIDGVASAAVLAVLVADRSLDALRGPVTERPYRKVSVECPDDAKAATMRTLESALPDAYPEAGVETEYGVRLAFDDGSWVLVRPSGTEPYVRVYAESESVDELVTDVVGRVESAVADV